MIDASELDDRAGFTRQAIAIRQDHVGGVLRVDDNMPGLGDHFAQGGTAQYILGVDGNAQSSDRREFACRIAHRASPEDPRIEPRGLLDPAWESAIHSRFGQNGLAGIYYEVACWGQRHEEAFDFSPSKTGCRRSNTSPQAPCRS